MFFTAESGIILGPIAWLFGKILNFLYNLLAVDGIANIGLIIIIFTVLVKLLMLPLTFKQHKSSKINSYIQPEIQKIQKKYKDKKDNESMMKMNEETQAVYKKYGTSMTGGCLTSLIQFPIIIALYRVIQNIPAYVDSVRNMYEPIAKGVYGLEGFKDLLVTFVDENKISSASATISALSKADAPTVNHVIDVLSKFSTDNWNAFQTLMNSNSDVVTAITANAPNIEKINKFIFGINIAEAPGWHLSWALLIPISSAIFQFLSSKVMQVPNQQGEGGDMAGSMMKSMTYTMPIFSLFICISMPAGVGIYWTLSAMFTLVTQLVINFYYDHTDMDKIIAKNVEKAKKKSDKKGNKKSLMDRMIEGASGQSTENMTAQEKAEFINNMSNKNLRNYDSSKVANTNAKKGSLASKANIMLNYEDNKSKGGDK